MTDSDMTSMRAAFEAVGQDHVFRFWDSLTEPQRRQLLEDLACINLAQLPGLVKLVRGGASESHDLSDLQPANVTGKDSVSAQAVALGRKLIAENRVAAFTVAGGQGTRLGFDGPKGAFPISPIRNKTLFQLFAESILATERRYGAVIPWYIMTSPGNDAETQAFLTRHQFFGLRTDRVRFFKQGVMPAFDADGRILMEEKHRVALSPDGHGGSLLAMATSGVLADMASRGVEYISYFQVDNPLVACIDPVFIGLHASSGAEMSSKTLPKADDLEKVGNFAMLGDRQVVIEYSDLPEALARARNGDGTRKFDAANIAIHVLSRSFVDRLTADRSSFALPWHLARKKAPCIDMESGERVEPSSPNAVKLEAFVFDALPLARHAALLGTAREDEFSPVKNKDGVDSVETSRRDLSRRAARWLRHAGVRLPGNPSDDDSVTCEISPLVALDADALGERVRNGECQVAVPSGADAALYLG